MPAVITENEYAYYFPIIMLATSSITNPDKINIDDLVLIADLDANRANRESRDEIVEFFYRVADYYTKMGDPGLAKMLIQAADQW